MSDLSQSEIAAHLDMTTRNLRDVMRELGLDWKKASLDEMRVAYIRKLRQEAAGRGEQELSSIRGRKELAQARREEFELAKEYKMVIRVDDVAPYLVGLMKEIQSTMLEAGNKSLQAIEATHELKLDDDLVLGHIRAALGNLAASGDQLVSTISGQPSASVSSATDTDGGVDRATHQTAGDQ